MQVISAMAHHGYLEQPGGKVMVEYIVHQCALPPEQEVRATTSYHSGQVLLRSSAVPELCWCWSLGTAGLASYCVAWVMH